MEKTLTSQESLALITRMIHQSQQNVQRSSFYFLIWGWVVILANLAHYYLLMYTDFTHPYAVWLISLPTAIVCWIYGARQTKKAVVRTHIDRIYTSIWLAFLFPHVVIMFSASIIGGNNINGMILLFVGFAVFISGKLLKFKPTVYGAFVIWLSALLCLYFNDQTQYLIAAFGVAIGYLIPGYMMKRKENNA